MGLTVIRINLAMLDELGDLVGFPLRQFQLCKKEDLAKLKPKKASRKPATKELVQNIAEIPALILPPKPEPQIATLRVKTEIIKVPSIVKKQVLEGGKFIFKDIEIFTDVEQEVVDTETIANVQLELDGEYNTALQAWEIEVARLEKERRDLVSTSDNSSTSLAMIDSVSEVEEYNDSTDGNCIWIDEHALEEYTKRGYEFTGEKRTSHCPPEWIANVSGGVILLLDDYLRADTRFIQACMSIMETQKYISWSLPMDSHVILTNNYDDGKSFVNAVDNAQKTRYITTNLKFEIGCWMEWAERNRVDGRAINFLNLHPEVITDEINPRSMTMFFDSIASVSDFDANLPLIQMLGEASVGPEVSLLFTMFINNKLDKLVEPKKMLLEPSESAIVKEIQDCVGTGDNYRADIASTLVTRLINYSILYAETNPITDKITKRITCFITNPDLFTDDLKYVIVKKILNSNKQKWQSLMLNKDVIAMTIK